MVDNKVSLGGQGLNPASPSTMPKLLKILVCVAPLVATVWIQPANAQAMRSRGKKSVSVSITHTHAIRSPVDRPSMPSPLVVSLSETELDDEREPDELTKNATASPISFTLNICPAALTQIRTCSDRLPLHAFSINSFLRC
jgi:hypothetical protein